MAKKNKKKGGGQQFLSDEQFIRQRMRALPLGECYITDGITEHGEGYVVVSRKHTGGRISFACYLVDAWCCGVKDSLYRLRQEDFEFDDFISQVDARPCSYDEAHNWVYGSIAFAEEAGIAPDKSFALSKYFLEEDTDDIPLIEFEFGKDGKHCLVAHSRLEASRYLPLLKKHLGNDGFSYILPGEMADNMLMGDDDDDLYEEDEESADDIIRQGDQPGMGAILKAMDKELLLHRGIQLWLNLDSSHSTNRLRREYRDQILNDPERILMLMTTEDVNILKAYKETFDEHPVACVGIRTPESHHQTMLELTGLALRRFEEDDEYRIYVAADFAEKVMPIIDKVAQSDKYLQLRYLESYIEGMANLYGEVRADHLKQQLKQHFSLESDDKVQELLDHTYDHSLALKMAYYTTINDLPDDSGAHFDETIFFMSRYGWLDYKREHALLSSLGMPHREFTKQEFVDAGLAGAVKIPNADQEAFEAFLRQIGHENDIQGICFDLWFFAAHEGDLQLGDKSYKTYFEDVVLAESQDRLAEQGLSHQEAMQRMEQYMDHMPRWMLRGHSPSEMQKT